MIPQNQLPLEDNAMALALGFCMCTIATLSFSFLDKMKILNLQIKGTISVYRISAKPNLNRDHDMSICPHLKNCEIRILK